MRKAAEMQLAELPDKAMARRTLADFKGERKTTKARKVA